MANLKKTIFCGGVIALLAGVLTLASACEEAITWKADLTGSAFVPPINSPKGANAEIVFNLTQPQATLVLNTKDLSDVTDAEVHIAWRGKNGPAIFRFFGPLATQKLDASQLQVHPEVGITTFTDAVHAIIEGKAYVTIATKLHPAGEVRGQIGMRKEVVYSATETGAGHDPRLHKLAQTSTE